MTTPEICNQISHLLNATKHIHFVNAERERIIDIAVDELSSGKTQFFTNPHDDIISAGFAVESTPGWFSLNWDAILSTPIPQDGKQYLQVSAGICGICARTIPAIEATIAIRRNEMTRRSDGRLICTECTAKQRHAKCHDCGKILHPGFAFKHPIALGKVQCWDCRTILAGNIRDLLND